MKKKNIGSAMVTLSILAIVLMVLYPKLPASYHYMKLQPTDLAEENVAGLYVNEDFYDGKVTYLFDEAEEIQQRIEGYDSFVLRNGIEVFVEEEQGLMERFTVTTNEVKTARDIGVGDTRKQVVDAYGENYYVHTKNGTRFIAYVDKERETVLEFRIVDDHVEMYKLESLSMN